MSLFNVSEADQSHSKLWNMEPKVLYFIFNLHFINIKIPTLRPHLVKRDAGKAGAQNQETTITFGHILTPHFMDEIEKIASSIDDHIKSLLVLENLADRNRFLFNLTKERVENSVKNADADKKSVLKTYYDPNLQMLLSYHKRKVDAKRAYDCIDVPVQPGDWIRVWPRKKELDQGVISLASRLSVIHTWR